MDTFVSCPIFFGSFASCYSWHPRNFMDQYMLHFRYLNVFFFSSLNISQSVTSSLYLWLYCIHYIVGGWLASPTVAGYTTIVVRKMVKKEMAPVELMTKPSTFSTLQVTNWSVIFLASFVPTLKYLDVHPIYHTFFL